MPLPPQPSFLNPKRKRLWEKYNGKCHWCGCETRLVNDTAPDKATIDHIIPRYKGGTNDPANLVNSCNLCNNRRNYEDHFGLAEGTLLGKYKGGQSNTERRAARRAQLKHIALTGDEKRAILERLDAGKTQPQPQPQAPIQTRPPAARYSTEEVLREQRDQAQKRIVELQKELDRVQAIAATQEKELKSITVVGLIRKRIAEWLLS
jgi:hypothetical protein